MNRTAALQATGHVAAPFVLVVGASLATLAVVGSPASGRIAAPAPTVTVTATPQPSPAHTTPPERRKAPGTTATLVTEHPPQAGPQAPPAGGAMATEQAPPEATSSARRCTRGRIVAVRLPLGVLPCDGITAGGSR